MGFIFEKIEEAIKELLIGWIESNLTNMFTDVNDKVGTIAAEFHIEKGEGGARA